MRILHLATSKHGGAGIAASRLNAALISEGYESSLVTLEEISSKRSPSQLKHFIVRKLFTVINQINTRRGYISTSSFSEGSITSEDLASYSPDIIHIHNWYNLLSVDSIVDIASKYPTAITMHDERLITGACHYSLDCNGYLSHCSSCPAVRTFQGTVSKNKREFSEKIQGSSRVIVIAPSQWLSNRFQKTAIAHKISKTKVIPNIIYAPETLSEFKQVPARTSDFNLLFAAINPDAPTKGLDLLIQAVINFAALNPRVTVNLDIVGKETEVKSYLKNLSFSVYGYQTSSSMGAFFKRVDLVVVPSRIDNSPSIVSEAQLNGVLVLATNVGGIPELITDSISGLLCEPNVKSLEAALNRAFSAENKGELVNSAFVQATKRHDRANIVREHILAYRKVLADE